MFKVGDIVKCVYSNGSNSLIKGKIYTVNHVALDTIFDMISVDDAKTHWYSYRFILDIKTQRKQKLKEICSNQEI